MNNTFHSLRWWSTFAVMACFVVVDVGCTTASMAPDDTDTMSDTDGMDTDIDSNGGSDGQTSAFAVFADPDSDFTTTEVRDNDGEEMRFDTTTDRLIWLADDSEHSGWTVSGNDLLGGAFRVRFGTEGGVPHAYFTETGPATVCNLFVTNGVLRVFSTSNPVPQN